MKGATPGPTLLEHSLTVHRGLESTSSDIPSLGPEESETFSKYNKIDDNRTGENSRTTFTSNKGTERDTVNDRRIRTRRVTLKERRTTTVVTCHYGPRRTLPREPTRKELEGRRILGVGTRMTLGHQVKTRLCVKRERQEMRESPSHCQKDVKMKNQKKLFLRITLLVNEPSSSFITKSIVTTTRFTQSSTLSIFTDRKVLGRR